MPNLVTKKFKVHNAEQFMESLSEIEATTFYFYVGKTDSWADEANVPAPTDSFANTNYTYWDQMLAAKKLTPADVSHIIPRKNWTYNNTYDAYDHEKNDLYDSDFYVVTEDFNVYKCLQNNLSNGTSTVKPTGTGLNPIKTEDGYVWKYMYTIKTQDVLKFTTAEFIPVKKVGIEEIGTKQYDIQAASTDGAIDIINKTSNGYFVINMTTAPTDVNNESQDFIEGEILQGGTSGATATLIDHVALSNVVTISPIQGTFQKDEQILGQLTNARSFISETPRSSYLFDEGTISSAVNTTTMLLSTSANNSADNLYVGSTIYITNNAAQGEKSKIIAFDSQLRRITVETPFTVEPNTSSGYIISPTVSVTGTGQLCEARAVGNNTHGLTEVVVLNKGSGYNQAQVSFSANSLYGNGATAKAIIGPIGGHGKNALEELGGNQIMIDVRLSGNESGYFTTDNDYRQIGIFRDPISNDDKISFFTAPLADQATRLTLQDISGLFEIDEYVYVGDNLSNSTANGIMIDIRDRKNMRLTNVLGTFNDGDVIIGETSGAVAVISENGVAISDIMPYSGDILYVENRAKVQRLTDQVENYKIVLEF